ncbi:lytic transglycosylase domain-containing protein [Micromonospora olivasterospora]|uniref:Soluble lytic murein transglycosylase-like protein n=1 Tax=Micromonospora olivasterospora TaxID=1880 RepID=A0A562I4B5_MICOL|nr:lytic transglycosylase domain-containing protein [Micromonospora olivasterospora]TWH65568.1 soluble lytic murein transglycosylase-like protein [Micromonospora olivasterospora]
MGSGWRRVVPAVTVGLLLATVGVGCADPESPPPGAAAPVDLVTEPPAEQPVEEPAGVERMGSAPSVAPSATAAATPTRKPRPTRTATAPRRIPKPPTETKVPPPPKKPAPGCTPTRRGDKATRAQVKAALTDAAGRVYWPTSAPDIRIPLELLKATAWQESGWQSDIVACDGGIGLMQVMPDTATWMNQRFGQSYDVDDYRDNAYLGATYLAWLTKYIGDMYFDSDYTLNPDLCDGLTSCLLNVVIAAYNVGHQAVAREGEPLTVPNPRYVENVRALMTGCECLAY